MRDASGVSEHSANRGVPLSSLGVESLTAYSDLYPSISLDSLTLGTNQTKEGVNHVKMF